MKLIGKVPLGFLVLNVVAIMFAMWRAQIHPASNDRQAIFDAMKGRVLAYGEIVGRFGG
jgi:hypothetical protein